MRNRFLLFFGLLILTTGVAMGQATATGTLLGVVTDASGAAVSGAQVTATKHRYQHETSNEIERSGRIPVRSSASR